MRTLAALSLILVTLASSAADEPKWRFEIPPGESVRKIEGLSTVLFVPRKLRPESGSSLLILLHGARAKAANLATFFRYWPYENYVVCAPQASKDVWTEPDLDRVRKISATLCKALPIDADRVHVAGFSNGAGNLHHIAFADEIKARSGTWVGMGYRGATPPPWAKTRFGALFMVGERDRFAQPARESIPVLRPSVRSIELIVEPLIGHTWPSSQIAYHLWWMGVQEGRFKPGEDLNFDWDDDLPEALAEAARRRTGVLVYVYDAVADRQSAAARRLQNEWFMAPGIRRLGRRLAPVMLERSEAAPLLKAHGVEIQRTPLVVVMDPKGAVRATLSPPFDQRALQAALESVAGGDAGR